MRLAAAIVITSAKLSFKVTGAKFFVSRTAGIQWEPLATAEGEIELIDQVAGLAGLRSDFNHSEALMPPVDLGVGKAAAVPLPAQAWGAEINPVDFGLGLFPICHVEKVQLVRGEFVAGKRVRSRVQPGPASFPGR